MIYQVRPGDSIVDIAIAFTGCPKCARTLVLANPTKPYRTLTNGFLTFQELYIGEYLNIPASWCDGTNKKIDKTSWPWPPCFDENWQQWYYQATPDQARSVQDMILNILNRPAWLRGVGLTLAQIQGRSVNAVGVNVQRPAHITIARTLIGGDSVQGVPVIYSAIGDIVAQ